MLRVKIDHERCRGHQMCVLGLSDVFEVGDDVEGRAEVANEEQPDMLLPKLEDVVASCPEQAISIIRGE
jgi:ferredoxin